MSSAAPHSPSPLLVDELFAGESPKFVETLRQVSDAKALAGLVDRWKRDPRPWARRQIVEYLQLPLNSPGHNVVVKRLFKQAEEQEDSELMGSFLVAFDRLIRPVRKTRNRYHWDQLTRRSWVEPQEFLYTPRNALLPARMIRMYDPKARAAVEVPYFGPPQGILFSMHTRRYVQRRAWRYFRRLGHFRPGEYVAAAAKLLAAYRQEDVARGEHLLESWSLLHLAYRESECLQFGSRIRLAPGKKLAELKAAPAYPELWQAPAAAPVLFELVSLAKSNLVRLWAWDLLQRDHGPFLSTLQSDDLRRLLQSENAHVRRIGSELLLNAKGLEKWPVAEWLALLETDDYELLATICAAMEKHLSAARLDARQCIDLAAAEPIVVARLGLKWLRQHSPRSDAERRSLAALGAARCQAIGRELAAWVLAHTGTPQHYDREVASALLDSLNSELREGAWEWLRMGWSPGQSDPVLWCRLLETPFEEMRLQLVNELQRKASLPGIGPRDLAPIWTAVLLGVHRGGRQKAAALAQLSAAIIARPEEAATLLPVLPIALRSLRLPERRAALSAIGRILEERPELEGLVKELMPELALS